MVCSQKSLLLIFDIHSEYIQLVLEHGLSILNITLQFAFSRDISSTSQLLDSRHHEALAIAVTTLAHLQSSFATLAHESAASVQLASGTCPWNISDNVDYPGNDLLNVRRASAELCCEYCSSVISCNAFTWTQFEGCTCFLKTSTPAGPVAVNPAPDESPYMRFAVVNKCHLVLQNTDVIATDLANRPEVSTDSCCGVCRSTYGCRAFAWPSFNGGICWLKSGRPTYVNKPGVTSGLNLS